MYKIELSKAPQDFGDYFRLFLKQESQAQQIHPALNCIENIVLVYSARRVDLHHLLAGLVVLSKDAMCKNIESCTLSTEKNSCPK